MLLLLFCRAMFEAENKSSKAALQSSELKLKELQEQHSRYTLVHVTVSFHL